MRFATKGGNSVATNQRGGRGQELLWDLLTFERLVTGPVIHLIYWSGIGVIFLIGFGFVGAAVGLALKEPGITSILLALPLLVAGLLVSAVLTLLWRGFCEFYVAIFRISDDLRALRRAAESEQAPR